MMVFSCVGCLASFFLQPVLVEEVEVGLEVRWVVGEVGMEGVREVGAAVQCMGTPVWWDPKVKYTAHSLQPDTYMP